MTSLSGQVQDTLSLVTGGSREIGRAVALALPPQAIIKDKDTWISRSDSLFAGLQGKGD